MTNWPRYVAFKSKKTGKYLRVIPGPLNALKFSGDKVLSPFTKFELEKARTEKARTENYVNIRCCYNNKYWSLARSLDDGLIHSLIDKPVEDPLKSSSTLFKLVREDPKTPNTVQEDPRTAKIFLNYNHNNTDQQGLTENESQFICVEEDKNGSCGLFEIIDMEKLILLPKYVAFKGDNEMFLKTVEYNNHNHLQFSASVISDPAVGFEIRTDGDGRIQIKSTHTKKFWEFNESGKWILASKEDPSSSENSWFLPLRLENNLIALSSLKNMQFCKRFTMDARDGENFLCANSSSITEECKLKVVELVNSRKIYNVRFHSENTRMYDEQRMTMVSKKVINKGVEGLITKQSLTAEKTRMTTWNTTTSWKLGASVSFELKFTEAFQAKLTLSGEYGEAKQFGETITTRDTVTSEETFQVPKDKKVIVSMVGTKAIKDIPFSYSQRDIFFNGETSIVDDMHDGVYSCLDIFDIEFMAVLEDHSPDDLKHLTQQSLENKK